MNLHLITFTLGIFFGFYSCIAVSAEAPASCELTESVSMVAEASLFTNNALLQQRGFTIIKFQGSEELIMKDLIKPPEPYPDVHEETFYQKYRNEAKQIIIISSRLGMGKSTLSLYLARILAQDGDRVLLLDMDPVNSSLSHLVNDGAALASISENLDFLSNLACNEISHSPSPDITGFLKATRTELSPYNFMIIDTQTGLNERNLSLLQDADTAILITTPDATSIFETYSLIKAANSYLTTKKLYLVINKVIDTQASKKAHQELNFALDYFLNSEILLLGMIHDDNSLCSNAEELILFNDTKFQQGALVTIHQGSQEAKNSKTREFVQQRLRGLGKFE